VAASFIDEPRGKLTGKRPRPIGDNPAAEAAGLYARR